jgi:predicted DNA-binding helix-hairpin-helix protein
MIVGATPTPDAQVLEQAASLYGKQKLRRVYYSAFSPIPDASPHLPLIAPPLVREHRLYQADWLLRFYGFNVKELTTPDAPNLSLECDPKTAWAIRHPEKFPVDINSAPRETLLRVPGLGVRNVDRLLQARRWHRIHLADLARLKVSLKKVMPFIIAADHKPALAGSAKWQSAVRPLKQLDLFETDAGVLNGQI